jgi:hypothetical protein
VCETGRWRARTKDVKVRWECRLDVECEPALARSLIRQRTPAATNTDLPHWVGSHNSSMFWIASDQPFGSPSASNIVRDTSHGTPPPPASLTANGSGSSSNACTCGSSGKSPQRSHQMCECDSNRPAAAAAAVGIAAPVRPSTSNRARPAVWGEHPPPSLSLTHSSMALQPPSPFGASNGLGVRGSGAEKCFACHRMVPSSVMSHVLRSFLDVTRDS